MCIAGGRIGELDAAKSASVRMTTGARTPIQLGAHEHLFFEGDVRNCLYIVECGWVKLYRTLVDGQRQVVGFASAGSILGLESDEYQANGCETITPVKVRPILMSSITELCLTDGKLAEQLLRQVGRQLGAAQAQLAAVGAQSAEQKLATFLLSIADLCDVSHDGEFDLPMRRGDMAEFLGLRLETVSRKITEFQRRGWIAMASLYHCRILHRSALQDLAAGGDAGDCSPRRAS